MLMYGLTGGFALPMKKPALLALYLICLQFPARAQSGGQAMAAELARGDAFKSRGQINEAYDCYLRAQKAAPQNYLPHRSLGEILGAQKKYDQALKETNMALALNPADYKLYVDRGLCYIGLGNVPRAEAEFKRAIVSPTCGHAVYKYLEDIYKKSGRIDEAIAVCDLRIKREAGGEEMYRHRAELMILKKDYAGARKVLAKATAQAPLNFANYELDGDICMLMNKPREALALYTKGLSLEPFFPSEIYLKRAKAFAKLGDPVNEKKDIESAHNKD